MDIIYVLLSTFFNSSKGYCSKRVSSRLQFFADNVDLCLLRSVVCTFCGLFFMLAYKIPFQIAPGAFLLAALAGISMTANYCAWVAALKTDAYMFANTAGLSGFVIAVLGGIFLLGEKMSAMKLLSMVLFFIAMLFMGKYQSQIKAKPTAKSISLLVILFLSQGTFLLAQKLFSFHFPEISSHSFTFYAYLSSIALLIALRAFIRYPGEKKDELLKIKRIVPYIIYMGIALYGATYFQALASLTMDAIVLYPLSNGLSLLSAMGVSAIGFKEIPNRNSIIGAVLVFIAMMLIKF